jgi:hypothetical protein
MSWEWIVKQLQGERTVLAKAGGRLVIGIGMNGRTTKPVRTELRELIVEILEESGELSTQDLYDEVSAAGMELTREALYSVCRKMLVKGQLQMRSVPRPNQFGKGLSLWKTK